VVAEHSNGVALAEELLDDCGHLVGFPVEWKPGADLQPAAVQSRGDRLVVELAPPDRRRGGG
jgi:hypothetical protein